MTSATIFTTIPYCTICYLLYQEFLTACVYPLSITGFLIVSANISNASSTTYHISYNSCFSYFLVLFVSIYCTNHLLETTLPFSLVIVFLAAIHIRSIYVRSQCTSKQLIQVNSISAPYHTSSSPIIDLHEVPYTCIFYHHGHIFNDSPSIRRRNSTGKVRGNYINFERQIDVKIMTSM